MGFSTDTKGRAFVATVQIKNMQSMGLEEKEYKNPEYLANFLTSLWEDSGKGRSCAVAVCMSADGLYHAHMALYGNTTTLKKVSDTLFHSHVEPQLGGKKELSAYLLKQGKYEEKGEEVLFLNGMENIQDTQGKRSDLEDIEEMLLKGMTPQEILDKSFRYYKYEKMILHAYISQRIQESPVKQDVYCEYHVGGERFRQDIHLFPALRKARGRQHLPPDGLRQQRFGRPGFLYEERRAAYPVHGRIQRVWDYIRKALDNAERVHAHADAFTLCEHVQPLGHGLHHFRVSARKHL
ncbi:MAG: hypothetical protein HFI82_12865 [Eubacterium sp.]|nr:hypothetical protein [Eubacterium sp.]